MKILQVHNRYRAGLGGEDLVVSDERKLLMEHGHDVRQYLASNADLGLNDTSNVIRSAVNSIWSSNHFHGLQKEIEDYKPDIVHIHNTFAILSPSVLWAVKKAGVPCILTLHNYRLICAKSTLYRENNICLECVGRFPIPALRHRCEYHDSKAIGMLITLTQIVHRMLKTYTETVDAFILLNDKFANIMKQAGFPEQRLNVKHNSVVDNFETRKVSGSENRLEKIVFVGQIEADKGIDILLEAWANFKPDQNKLIIVGDGSMKTQLQDKYRHRTDIDWQGRLPQERVFDTVRQAKYLVMPSQWYEPFGLVAIEAMMLATPVIIPNHVTFAESVEIDSAGFVYKRASPSGLSLALGKAFQIERNDWRKQSDAARKIYVNNFTPAQNYKALMHIYSNTINLSKKQI